MAGFRRASLAFAAALVWASGGMAARAQQAPEDRVRAAFLYQLAQYVTWLQGAPSKEPFRICVYGNDGFS
ncbi:MAG: YfiR family protein [Acidobacteria bacterium]|nr:YfiR family protein [Acidobacteriota bacterium]